MYQLGGRALGGHRPEGLSHRFKNVLSRGIWGELPSAYPGQLKALLAPLFPGHPQILLFPHRIEAENFLAERYGNLPLLDPAMAPLERGRPALWRPLCPGSYEEASALMPILPFPGNFAPAPVCLGPGEPFLPEEERVTQEMGCSPVLTAALIQAVTLLPKLADKGKEGTWSRFDGISRGFWRRTGPYLAFTGGAETYGEFFKGALEAGILLHPGTDGPSIIPLNFTDGEIVPLWHLMKHYGN